VLHSSTEIETETETEMFLQDGNEIQTWIRAHET